MRPINAATCMASIRIATCAADFNLLPPPVVFRDDAERRLSFETERQVVVRARQELAQR